MSADRNFVDTAFTYSDINVPKWVTVSYRRAKNGDITITEIRDTETEKNILNHITSVSYKRLAETAKHLGDKYAVPDSSD